MKNIFMKSFLGFILLTLCMCVTPLTAMARGLSLNNHTPFRLEVALCYENYNGWEVYGWTSIEPYSQIKRHLSDKSRNIYVYAKALQNGETWAGQRNDGNDRSFYVTDTDFHYTVGQIPSGRNRKRVRFQHVDLKNHSHFDYHFTYNAR